MTERCKFCNDNHLRLEYKKPHLGLYCNNCNHWIEWIKKEETKDYLENTNILKSEEAMRVGLERLKHKIIIYDANIDGCFKNDKYEGITINWDSNKGFGQLTILKNGDNIDVDTETMANNEHKQFIRDVLLKLVDKMNVIE